MKICHYKVSDISSISINRSKGFGPANWFV